MHSGVVDSDGDFALVHWVICWKQCEDAQVALEHNLRDMVTEPEFVSRPADLEVTIELVYANP